MNIHHLGTTVRITGAFTDAGGAAVDPDTISLTVRDPSGNETTYTYGGLGTIAKDSVGNYHQDVTTDEEGFWYYEWQGTGTSIATDEKAFFVSAGEV